MLSAHEAYSHNPPYPKFSTHFRDDFRHPLLAALMQA